MKKFAQLGTLVLAAQLATGCGGGNKSGAEGSACSPDDACNDGLLCVETGAADTRCYPPVEIRGQVLSTEDDTGIADAQVVALNPLGAPVGDLETTAADGTYTVSVPAARSADTGAPLFSSVTLRASASGFQGFPGGLRTSLPIDLAGAVEPDGEGPWVVESTLTTVTLIPLPAGEQVGTKIEGTAELGGTLVVAEGSVQSFSSVSDQSGNFTIFNTPDDTYTVRGYLSGNQYSPEMVTVSGADPAPINLVLSTDPTATISGSIQMVNAPGGALTSVVLAVKATFDPLAAKGDVPPGLRVPESGAPSISTDWSISGVPDGEYVILAAFENDDLVRDPDTSIAGTAILEITLPDPVDDRTLRAGSFKVTEALAVSSPGANGPEAVTEPFDLTWADDAGEDYYYVQVFDAFGQEVWETTVDRVNGSSTVSVTYGGPSLEAGLFYQFRVTSRSTPGGMGAMRNSATDPALSATEDLKGVFFLEQP